MSAFAFNLVRVNSGSALLGGISSPSFDRRLSERPLSTDGQLHQTGAAVLRTAPMASFTTVAVRSLFNLLGTNDEVPFVALDNTNGIELFGAKINTSPGYIGGSVHARRKLASGLLMLNSVSWSPGDIARAECSAYGTSNGTLDPVVADTLALPALPVNTEQLVTQSLVLGALSVDKLSSINLAITHQVENNVEEICYSSGLPHPVLLSQPGVGGATEIMLTVETLDLTSSISNGTVIWTLAVLNNLGVGLGSNTAIITLNNPTIRETVIRGEDGSAGKRQITCRALFDGTNKPLTIATA